MEVEDFSDRKSIDNAEELEQFMMRRVEIDRVKYNCFVMANGSGTLLYVWVRDESASLWFSPNPEAAGFKSVNASYSNWDGTMVRFYEYKIEEVALPSYSIIEFSDARRAATEFMLTNALPKAIEWIEL